MRKYNFCNMAWWHTYKHACMRIWNVFSTSVWGPLWFHMYPGHAFCMKPSSMPMVSMHLPMMHLAYPQFADKLAELGERSGVHELNWRSKIMLADLRFLCCVAIPVVIWSCNLNG